MDPKEDSTPQDGHYPSNSKSSLSTHKNWRRDGGLIIGTLFLGFFVELISKLMELPFEQSAPIITYIVLVLVGLVMVGWALKNN